MTRRTPWAICLVAVALVVGGASAHGARSVMTRAWAHDGFGRIVFDWGGDVRYAATLEGRRLVLRFERPMNTRFGRVLQYLERYVADAALEDDGRTVVFTLKRAYAYRTFTNEGSVVVDLLDDGAAPAGTANPGAPKPEGPRLGVRVGEHPDFTRIVFDWTRRVGYRLARFGDALTLSFDRPAAIDSDGVRDDLPAGIGLLSVVAVDRGLKVRLKVPEAARPRHFRSGTKVVLDILEPRRAAPPPAEPVALPMPITRPPPRAEQPPAAEPPAVKKAEKAEKEGAPEPPPKSLGTVAVGFERAGSAATLAFEWPESVAAAAFDRGGHVWIVFDRPATLDLEDARTFGRGLISGIEQLDHRRGTVLRVAVPPGFHPFARRTGNHWRVELKLARLAPPTPIRVLREAEAGAATPRVLIETGAPGRALEIRDPEVGDRLIVVPVAKAGIGLDLARDFVPFRLLAAGQGVVIRPIADDLRVRTADNGVEITSDAGLYLSETVPVKKEVEEKETPVEKSFADLRISRAAPLFDFAAWRRGPRMRFTAERRVLEDRILETPLGERGRARLDLARFYFAHGYAEDALGVLRLLGEDAPKLAEQPAVVALRGASEYLAGHYEDATRDLGIAALDVHPQASLWRAAVAAARHDWETASQEFARAGRDMILSSPEHLRRRFALLAAETAARIGDTGEARFYLERVLGEGVNPAELSRAAFLHGLVLRQEGDVDGALEIWDRLVKGHDRLSRAQAGLARVNVMLETEKMAREDAIEALERLRFAWRGDDLELNILRRLGSLYIEEGQYENGLTTLKQAATYFPNNPAVEGITEEMTDAFIGLFLEGGADSLTPVKALALYQEFKELTPAGKRGDEMIRRLADRLVDVDLLNLAGDLLAQQVKFRLSGAEKARVGTRLAVVRLLDRKPGPALAALEESRADEVPADLATKRRHLRARALLALDRMDEALAALEGDTSRDADLLRAGAHWRAQNWPRAAKLLARLVGDESGADGGLGDGEARLVLKWAVALTLSQDWTGIEGLRRRFETAMAKTPYRDDFRLLTKARDGNVPHTLKAIMAKVAEVGQYEAFMASYRERLQNGRLSAIN